MVSLEAFRSFKSYPPIFNLYLIRYRRKFLIYKNFLPFPDSVQFIHNLPKSVLNKVQIADSGIVKKVVIHINLYLIRYRFWELSTFCAPFHKITIDFFSFSCYKYPTSSF